MTEQKEKLLKTLKDFGRLPTSRVAAICGMNQTTAFLHLRELLEQGKIIKEQETVATYWRIVGDEQKNN